MRMRGWKSTSCRRPGPPWCRRTSGSTWLLKEDQEAEAQLDAERAHAAAIEALLQAEPDVVDVNRAAEAQLEAERTDGAAIEALLQAEPDVLDLNRALEARLDAERADAAAIEALP